ncbi:odorant receptor 49b-like [Cylas formicarius]|uniref:odorant receptor 49b-like n=1 Tax=Cylas formicarius TaxID=197179 RepID=UPI0029588D12|nr:odorant receptor 49b-like [Cylas formicarius]
MCTFILAFQAISMILFSTMASIKGIMCQFKYFVRLQKIIIEEEAMLLAWNDQKTKEIYTKHTKYSKKLSKFFLLAAGLAASVLVEMGCTNSYKVYKMEKRVNVSLEKPLPLKLWYPWDKNRYHILTIMSQFLDIAVTAFYVAVAQIFTTTLLIFLRAKLQIMQHQFRNFDRNFNNRDIITNGVETVRMLCVKHQNLIELINSVNEALRNIIFVEFSMSSVMFAAGILQVIAGQDLLLNIEFSISMISFLMLLAWNANEIREQSSKLAMALYESKWYEQKHNTKAIIHFMIIGCQKPLSINIGPLGPITVDAAMSRIRLAYSYSSVMSGEK